MEEKELSRLEGLVDRGLALLRKNALPLLSAIAAGLLAHMFIITNKIPNHDDVMYLFDKGGTVSSGRWGLEIMRLIFPDYSMSWLYGLSSILIMAVAVCFIVRLFEIQNRLSQVLLPALILTFPSQSAIMCYAFTSTCYAVAFLMAVAAAVLLRQGGWKKALVGTLLVFLTLSLYQGFLAITASLLIVLVIKDVMAAGEEDRGGELFKTGLGYVLPLVVAMGLYFISLKLTIPAGGEGLNDYSSATLELGPKPLEGLALAYYMFIFNLTSRYNLLIVSKLSRLLHFVCILIAASGIVYDRIKARNLKTTLVLLLCLALLPLSIGYMYVVVFKDAVHTIVLFGYISLYVLAFVAVERLPKRFKTAGRDLMLLMMTAIVLINVSFANTSYLRLHLKYEGTYSYATILLAQVRSLPGYTEDLKLAVYKYEAQYNGPTEEGVLPDEDFVGLRYGLIDNYQAQERFFEYFLGTQVRMAPADEAEALAYDSRTADMPCYPNEGSIRILDDYVFVKLLEPQE